MEGISAENPDLFHYAKTMLGWSNQPNTRGTVTNTCAGIGLVSTIVCNVALIIIISLGFAKVLPMAAVAGSTIGLSGGLFISTLIRGEINPSRICQIIISGLVCAISITLGGLGLANILTINQLGIGILVTHALPVLFCGCIVSCFPCIFVAAVIAGAAIAIGALKAVEKKTSSAVMV